MTLSTAQAAVTETDDDASLMARVARGDRGAFARLVDRHSDGLVAYLARLTGSPERGEDLAQEALLRVFRAAESYRERGHFTAFLYRIATNLVRSEARRELRWRLLAPELGAPRPAVEEPRGPRLVARRELQRRLAVAVAALPVSLRAPLVLYEIEGWPQRDIARALGCRVGTVKSRIHRARARLREELAEAWQSWNGMEA